MGNYSPDIQVLIPYKQLLELLEASQRYQELAKDFQQLRNEQAALRILFTDLMDKFREIQ